MKEAFPYTLATARGMDLRDYFAAHAISGLLQVYGVVDEILIAEGAYMIADCMLAEREPFNANARKLVARSTESE